MTTKHYMKGWTQDIPSFTDKLLGSSSAYNLNIPHLPAANTALQISSSDAGDVGLPILIQGYDDSFNAISEVAIVNGYNAINLTSPFFRISQMLNVSPSANNQGEIFLSLQGASLSNGVPVEADWLYSMKSGDNVGALAIIFLPPGLNRVLMPQYVLYSVANDSRDRVKFLFQTKYSNSNIWLTQFEFYVDERSNSQFNWPLTGLPDLDLSDLSKGMDIRIIANKLTNNNSEVSASCSWAGETN